MTLHRFLVIIGLCVLSAWYSTFNVVGAYELSHGRQVILDRGLQIQAMVGRAGQPGEFAYNERWLNSNFTTINFWDSNTTPPSVLQSAPLGTQWGRMEYWDYGEQTSTSIPTDPNLRSGMVSLQFRDEQLGSSGWPEGFLAYATTMFAKWKNIYPNTLGYTNVNAAAAQSQDMSSYMATMPDMLSFSYYPGFHMPRNHREFWYTSMKKYRDVGLAGYDGSGTSPIPYAQFLDLYRTSYDAPLPSESFVRLQQFASWAFGYSMVTAYVYSSLDYTALFSSVGDSSPTVAFDYVAETNRQSRNLGLALTQLVSTDVFIKPATGYSVGPTGLTAWSPGAGTTANNADYITAITPYTNSTANGGNPDSSHDDVLIGYFEPLLSDNSAGTFVDGLNFMIVNGSVGGWIPLADGTPDPVAMLNGSAAAQAQWYHLEFDFTGSTFDSLVRLSRDSGEVELVTLTPVAGSEFYLDLNLPGGTGDLFGFWDSSNPLPTVPEPPDFKLPGDANRNDTIDESDAAVLAATWQTLTDATWEMGDFNNDGAVNDIDATLLAANWGVATSASVPEPSTVVLAMAAIGTLALLRRRRN